MQAENKSFVSFVTWMIFNFLQTRKNPNRINPQTHFTIQDALSWKNKIKTTYWIPHNTHKHEEKNKDEQDRGKKSKSEKISSIFTMLHKHISENFASCVTFYVLNGILGNGCFYFWLCWKCCNIFIFFSPYFLWQIEQNEEKKN